MTVNYDSTHVKKLCKDKKYALKAMDLIVYKKLSSIINFIENADSLLDIKNYPSFHFHNLDDEYKDQWAIYVGQTGYRIHIIPQDSNNKLIKKGDVTPHIKNIKIILIKEVSNHYDKQC